MWQKKCRRGLKISNMGTWKGRFVHFYSTALGSHPTGTSNILGPHLGRWVSPSALGIYVVLNTVLSSALQFKGLLLLLFVLAILLLLKVISLQSGMIYCQDFHWDMAELLEYQVVIPCFFLNSRISTGCQFYDVFQSPFQLGFTWLLSGQWDVYKSTVNVGDFWYPCGHSVTSSQYLSIKLMPCY